MLRLKMYGTEYIINQWRSTKWFFVAPLLFLFIIIKRSLIRSFLPALMVQSDASPTGDQEIARTIPAGSGNNISWNIFYGHSLPSADSRRAVLSFWRKNVHKYYS